MAQEETSKINIQIAGAEKALEILVKFEETMLGTSKAAVNFVTTLNTIDGVFVQISKASLKPVSAQITALGTAFNKFGQQFSTKGVQALLDNKNIPALVTNLTPFINMINSFPTNFDKLANLGLALQKVGVTINDKNFAVAPANLRKLATAFEKVATIFSAITIPQAPIDGLQKLFLVLEAFMQTRGEKNIGPILQAIATGILTLDGALKNSKVLGDPTKLVVLQGLATALKTLGMAFERFGKSFQTGNIFKNFSALVTQIEVLYASLGRITNVDEFSRAMNLMADSIGKLSKAFRSITIGKNLPDLDKNTALLIKFINDLGTIDADPIVAKLAPLADVIKNLADAGRAIGALKGIDTTKAKITALGVEITKTGKISDAIWKSITRGLKSAIAKMSKDLLTLALKPLTDRLKAAVIAFQNFSGAIIKLPFKIITAPLQLLVTLFKKIADAIMAIFAPLTNLTNIFGKFFSKTKVAKKSVDDLGESSGALGKKVESATPKFDKFGNEIVQATTSSKLLGLNLGFLGKAINSIKTNTIDKLKQSFDGASQGTSNFLLRFISLQSVLGVVNRLLLATGRALKALGTFAIDAFAETEQLKMSLKAFQAIELVDKFADVGGELPMNKAMEQSIKLADELFAKFQKLAKQSPYEVSALVNTFNTLQTFKFNTKDAMTLTQILVDFGATVGISNLALDEFALIFGQIRAAGKLLGQDLKQLQTRGIDVGGALVKFWKEAKDEVISTAEALEKAKEGLISADDVIVAIATHMNDAFGGNAQRMNSTITALKSTFSDIKKMMAVDMFGPAIEAAKPFINLLFELLQSEKVTKAIKALAVVLETTLVKAFNTIGTTIKVAIELWKAMPAPVQEVIKQIALFTIGMVAATVAAGVLIGAFALIGMGLSLIINPISLTIGAISGLALVIYRNINNITKFFNQFNIDVVEVFNNITTSFNTFVTKMITKVSELSNRFASNFAATLSSMAEFGYNIISQFASGILAAMSLVASALQKLGGMIAYWLAPGSPPRLLPEIDQWGSEAAGEFLTGFTQADFSSIGDFGGTLSNLLKSLKVEDVNTSGLVKAFSESLNSVNAGENADLSGIFEQIAASVPTASSEVEGLVSLYIRLAQETRALDEATNQYTDAISQLEGQLTDIEDVETVRLEEAQIKRFERISQSQFVTDAQRQKALQEIQKIRATQQIRNLKKEQDQNALTVAATEEEIALLKERIDLANQFALVDPVEEQLSSLDAIKDKVEEAGDSMAESIGGAIEDIELAMESIDLNLPEFDTEGIMSKFQTLSDNIKAAIEKIKTAFSTSVTTLIWWKDEFLRIFGVVSAAILPVLTRIYNNLKTEFTKIANVATKVTTAGGKSDILGSILGFTTADMDTSIGKVIGNIGLAFTNLKATIKKKVSEFTTLLSNNPDMTIQDALSTTVFGVTVEELITKVKSKINLIIQSIINYIPSRIALAKALMQIDGVTPMEAILFAMFGISQRTTDEVVTLVTESIDKIITNIKEHLNFETGESFGAKIMKFFNIDPASLTGIAESFALLEKVFQPITKIFSEGEWGKLFASIKRFIDAIVRLIGDFLPILAVSIGLIMLIIAPILQELPAILSGVLDALTSILGFISDVVESLYDLILGKISLGDFIKKITTSFFDRVDEFIKSVANVAAGLVKIIHNFVSNIFALFGKEFDPIALISSIGPAIENAFNALGDWLKEKLAWTAFIDGAIIEITDALIAFPENIKILLLSALIELGRVAFGGFLTYIMGLFSGEGADSPMPGSGPKKLFSELLPDIGFIDELLNPIKTKFEELKTFFDEFKLPNIFEAFEIPESVKQILRFAGIDVGSTIAETATEEVNKMQLIPPPLDATEWEAVGKQSGTNIATGVSSGFDEEATKPGFFTNAKNKLIDSWASMWDSNSPSKVAADMMGLPIAQGIQEGILEGIANASFIEMFTLLYESIILETTTFNETYSALFVVFSESMLQLYSEYKEALLLLLKTYIATVLLQHNIFSEALKLLLTNLYAAIVLSTTTFKDTFISIGQMAVDGFLAKFIDFGLKIIELINAAFNAVRDAFDEKTELAYTTGYSVGQMFADGIINGINEKIPGLLHTIRQMISAAIAAAQAAMDSASPSKRTAKEIGMPFGQGIEKGIDKSFQSIDKLVTSKLGALSGINVPKPNMGVFNKSVFDANTPSIHSPSGSAKNVGLQRSIAAANQTSVVNNFNKEYHMHMTVTPERASQVRRNFSVTEFLGV